MNKFVTEIIKDVKKCLLVFASGKIIATGFKSLSETRECLKNIFPSVNFIKIVNITAVSSIKSKPNISMRSDVSYEPELFSACVWRGGKMCGVYYATGRLILTGCKSYRELRHLLREFKKSINTGASTSIKS